MTPVHTLGADRPGEVEGVVAKDTRKKRKSGKATPHDPSDADGAKKTGRKRSRRERPRGSRTKGKGPIFRFVLLFGILMGLFELACATSFVKDTVFPAYLRFNARASATILALFEDSVSATGQSISGRYSLSIERGCDAIEPSALFIAGVLAFPAAAMSKLPGMLIGTVCLMVLNLVRIVSLYYVGVYYPRLFHIMHVDVWQALFIFLAILFWFLWALWATRPKVAKANAVSATG